MVEGRAGPSEDVRALGGALVHALSTGATVLLVWWLAGLAGAPDALRGALAVGGALAPGAYGWSTLDILGQPLAAAAPPEEEATFRLDGVTLRRAPGEELTASDFAHVARMMPGGDPMRARVARLTPGAWRALREGDPRKVAVFEVLDREIGDVGGWVVDGRAPLVAFLAADGRGRMAGTVGIERGRAEGGRQRRLN